MPGPSWRAAAAALQLLLCTCPDLAHGQLRLLSPDNETLPCSTLCQDGRCGDQLASISHVCSSLLLQNHRAVGQNLLASGPWTITDAQLTVIRATECSTLWAQSLSGEAPSACEACSDDYEYSEVAGKVVVVPLHGCTVQEKATRLAAAGATAVLTIARREVEFLGLYSENAKVYSTPASRTVPNAAPTAMVERSVGKALLGLLTHPGIPPIQLRVNLTACASTRRPPARLPACPPARLPACGA